MKENSLDWKIMWSWQDGGQGMSAQKVYPSVSDQLWPYPDGELHVVFWQYAHLHLPHIHNGDLWHQMCPSFCHSYHCKQRLQIWEWGFSDLHDFHLLPNLLEYHPFSEIAIATYLFITVNTIRDGSKWTHLLKDRNISNKLTIWNRWYTCTCTTLVSIS